VEYLLLWQGFGPANDLWEQAKDLSNCQERVKEYETAIPADEQPNEGARGLRRRPFQLLLDHQHERRPRLLLVFGW
jgi:hypothetical protein